MAFAIASRMQASDIAIGSTYLATVSGKPTRVRIDAARDGGWDATNWATGKQVHVTADRLTALPPSTATAASVFARATRAR